MMQLNRISTFAIEMKEELYYPFPTLVHIIYIFMGDLYYKSTVTLWYMPLYLRHGCLKSYLSSFKINTFQLN